MRDITYRKATPERLKQLLEKIGYKVTSQSTDGSWKLIRLPDGTSTSYWLLKDRIEHKLDDFRGGTSFFFKDCIFKLNDNSVLIVAKNSASVFIAFYNFESHKTPPKPIEETK